MVRVILVGTNATAGQQVESEITQNGGLAHFMKLDIRDESAVDQAFATIQQEWGGCQILINNAGISKDFLMMRSKSEDWRTLLDVNLVGALNCSRAAIKSMVKGRWGRIINMSSIVALTGNPGQTVYSATKAALIGLTKSLAKELGGRNVTVNAIAPGFIATEMTDALPEKVRDAYLQRIPLGRFGEPAEVGHLAAFLASDEAAYITGQVLTIDGGLV